MATSLIQADSIFGVTYPSSHKIGMRVPKGGSSCARCEYLGGPHKCGNKNFIEAVKSHQVDDTHITEDGKAHFDPPADEYCCDFFEMSDKDIEAGGPGSGRHSGENHFIFVQHPEKGTYFQYVNDKNWNDPSSKAAQKYRDHLPLMEKLGMPTSGKAYDRVTRGYGSAYPDKKRVFITIAGNRAGDDYDPRDVKRELETQFPGYYVDHPLLDLDAAKEGWHGVDFDGTIAEELEPFDISKTGKPIKGEAFKRVQDWIRNGELVKIFTARARDPRGVKAIQDWCEKYFGEKLEVTNKKDELMLDLLDNRASKVDSKTGDIIAYGTSEGLEKAWDTRGRGQHQTFDPVPGVHEINSKDLNTLRDWYSVARGVEKVPHSLERTMVKAARLGEWIADDFEGNHSDDNSFFKLETKNGIVGALNVESISNISHVHSLATRPDIIAGSTPERGVGTRLMIQAARYAAAHNQGLHLSALDGAEGFYEHIGMHQTVKPTRAKLAEYEWSPEEVQAFAKHIQAASDLNIARIIGRAITAEKTYPALASDRVQIQAYGTTEGALKGWDTRGRSPYESDQLVQRFKTGEKPPEKELNDVPFSSAVIVTGNKLNPDEVSLKTLVNKDIDEPPFPEVPKGMHAAAGIIMQEKDGRLWTVTPMNYYDGYVNTFPKGTIDKDETPQEAAIRETHEETGLVAKITGYAGDVTRTTSVTRYYFGERVGGTPQDADEETYKVNLIPGDEHLADRMRDAEGYKTPDHKLLDKYRESPDYNDILDEKISGAKGTNPGGIYKGADGVERYVKFYKNPVQAHGEVLANNLYRDLGLSAPESKAFNYKGNIAVANNLLPGKQLNETQLTPDIAKNILKGFAADVLTVNWDAVGLQHDNVMVDGDKIHRIDNGGTFLMRAQQGYKPESGLYGVGELQSLFNPKINPAYSKVASAAGVKSYQDIPDFKQQVNRITKLEKDSGGWSKYVKEHTPGLKPDLQNTLTKILDARTEGLKEALHTPKMEASGYNNTPSSIWHGVFIVGFTEPEEEAIRSILARIPPELLSYVACVQSAQELNAKHGKYIASDKKILFNPGNLLLRAKFGGGENPIRHDILTLVHEVGHSLYDNLSDSEKQQWLKLSGWQKGWSNGQAPAYVERRPGWEHYTSEYTHKAGVKFPRYYAEKNPNEHFADAFAYFMLNKGYKLADDQREYFENYISNHVKRYPQALIQSPVKAAMDEIVAAVVTGISESVHAGGFNERLHGSVPLSRKALRQKHHNRPSIRGRGLTASQYERANKLWRAVRQRVKAFGTTEGAIKGWDTRGRGRKEHPKAEIYKKLFEKKELGKLEPLSSLTPKTDLEQTKQQITQELSTLSPGEKKKYKPGEKQMEKFQKFQSGDYKPKGGKVGVLGGIWSGNAAPTIIYKTMMTGEWFSKADLASKMDQDILSKWAKDHATALAKGDTKFWSVEDRIQSGINRVQKAGQLFGQWKMEMEWKDGTQRYRLVMNLVHDQAKGQEGITQDVQHKALLAIQKMINNKGLDTTVSKQAMDDYLSSVGVKNVSALSSCVGAWTGSAQSLGATKLKMVAAEYYGNDWNKEYENQGMTKNSFNFDELKKQALAIKALSNEYMKASGVNTLYRGLHGLPSSVLDKIRQAVTDGKPVPIPLNSMSGYSTSLNTSSNFGSDLVLKATVKPEEVWVASGALPHLFGSFAHGEKEYLVGSKSNTVVWFDPKDVWVKDKAGYAKTPKPDWVLEHYKQKYGEKFDPSKV